MRHESYCNTSFQGEYGQQGEPGLNGGPGEIFPYLESPKYLGLPGLPGENGYTGIKGIVGEKGLPGNAGEQGQIGSPGEVNGNFSMFSTTFLPGWTAGTRWPNWSARKLRPSRHPRNSRLVSLFMSPSKIVLIPFFIPGERGVPGPEGYIGQDAQYCPCPRVSSLRKEKKS